MSVVIDAPRASALARPALDQGATPSPQIDRHKAAIEAARAAGRLAGERLISTPLGSRQRVTVTAVMGSSHS